MSRNTFQYRTYLTRFLTYFLILTAFTAAFLAIVYESSLPDEIRQLVIFFGLNIYSMLTMALLMLAYIHWKSPHNQIILDEDMIIIPRISIIPDSLFIRYEDIIYESHYDERRSECYKIVFSGGSATVYRRFLKNDSDWNEIIYSLKSVLQ